MIECAEADNMEKYRSYIQRRRVAQPPPETKLPAEVEPPTSEKKSSASSFGKAFAEESEASYTESYSDSFKGFSDFAEKREEPYETSHRDSPFKDFMNDSKRDSYTKRSDAGPSYHASGTAALRRTDHGIYRKLYGQNKKGTYGSSYAGAYHGPHQAEIEDNRATVLAVKIIKQAIACFAILGILVLMQQRTDMGQALAFVKKQVIEINVDPQSILSGVEDLVKQCTKFLGGSP